MRAGVEIRFDLHKLGTIWRSVLHGFGHVIGADLGVV